MKRLWWLGLMIAVAFTSVAGPVRAADAARLQEMAHQFQRRMGPTGAIVIRVPDGRVMLALNADQKWVPASTIKIVTAYAGLKVLGPDFRFKTRVYTAGPIEDGHLAGDLIIQGGGDPLLVAERLWLLALQIRRTGLKSVGGIRIDNTYLNPPVTSTVGRWDRNRAHSAPLAGFAVSFNALVIVARPGPEPGSPGQVFVTPDVAGLVVDNQTTTTPGQGGIISARWRGRTLVVSGRVGQGAPAGRPRTLLAVYHPATSAARALAFCLRRLGLKVGDRFTSGPVPGNARLLLTHLSQPLSFILSQMNRFSSNVMAELTLAAVGAKVFGRPASQAKGARAAGRLLVGLGIPATDFHLTCGSGLLRSTRIAPRALARVLLAAAKDPDVGPDLLASLTAEGRRGTLRARRNMAGGRQYVRGKTGSLAGVRSLAGYVSDGRVTYVFAFMSRSDADRRGYHYAIGRILRALYH
jgi:D-alanyl-D-alanine carboxypeptidase/D-alanyl-D-alanine-endopeptidase (penicillin-binding protein 4)